LNLTQESSKSTVRTVFPRLHRNSQKSYRPGATYFITSVTYERYPYFEEAILADLLVLNIWFARELKQFDLYGYTVLPEHMHLMFKPIGPINHSMAMQNIKRVFSLQANQIIFSSAMNGGPPGGEDIYPHPQGGKQQNPYETLEWSNLLSRLRDDFTQKHGASHLFPKFKWQKSFRDHLIRGNADFENHLRYVYRNAVKHQLVEEPTAWKWMWVRGMDRHRD
jgi:REP element-mobilizing transposase RayT